MWKGWVEAQGWLKGGQSTQHTPVQVASAHCTSERNKSVIDTPGQKPGEAAAALGNSTVHTPSPHLAHTGQFHRVRPLTPPCTYQAIPPCAPPHPAVHVPGLMAVRQLPTILAQATSMLSAGLRSDTKTLRSTRASSGSRSRRCNRCSCSGHRVICASCFCASLARTCSRCGDLVSGQQITRPPPAITGDDSPAPADPGTPPSEHWERLQAGWLVGYLAVLAWGTRGCWAQQSAGPVDSRPSPSAGGTSWGREVTGGNMPLALCPGVPRISQGTS